MGLSSFAGVAHAHGSDGQWNRRCEDGGVRKRCDDGGVRRIIGSKQGRTIWGSMDGGVVHDGCSGGWKLRGLVIAPRCIFVFCISVICAAYCCVLQVNGGLVCDESPVFFGWQFTRKIDGFDR